MKNNKKVRVEQGYIKIHDSQPTRLLYVSHHINTSGLKLRSVLKYLILPNTTEMTTSIQFPRKEFFTPHRYKRTLRTYLTSNGLQTFTRCKRGMDVSCTNIFLYWPFFCWWHHQIRQKWRSKKLEIKKNGGEGHRCVRSISHELLASTRGRLTLGPSVMCQGRARQ